MENRLIISAHQPNFLPNLTYFKKIVNSDIHVILDDVDFTYKHKDSYTHRTKIKGNNSESKWLTLGVHRSEIPINLIEFRNHKEWLPDFRKLLISTYGISAVQNSYTINAILTRLPHYQYLSEYNESLIEPICGALGLSLIPVRMIKSSELDYDRSLKKEEKLKAVFDIASEGNDYKYLSGTGAKNFLTGNLFDVEYIKGQRRSRLHLIIFTNCI